jgi:hypothetical protein
MRGTAKNQSKVKKRYRRGQASPKSRRDTGEDSMMIERYSRNQSKLQKRYKNGQDDDGKVQQRPVQSSEQIQQRTE